MPDGAREAPDDEEDMTPEDLEDLLAAVMRRRERGRDWRSRAARPWPPARPVEDVRTDLL